MNVKIAKSTLLSNNISSTAEQNTLNINAMKQISMTDVTATNFYAPGSGGGRFMYMD